ncbi:MAG: PAS domain-containing protein, partial [Verrucomicrobia bacterium]|nr:PAS domain-containing protein [Verrucomicrobiota bacterium]
MNREPSNEANRSEVIGNTVPGRRLMTRAAVFGLAYFLAHEIAFLIPDANQVLMAVWPASGIGLAALLLSPRQQWGVLLGVFFVAGNLANLSAGRPMLTSAGSMTANVLESLACAWLISRWCGGQVRLGHVLEVVALIVAATLVNAGSAFLGATTAAILSGGRFWQLYQSWWSANGLGILLVTPLIVARCRESRRSRFPGWGQSAEIAMLASAACGLSAFAFGPASTLPNSSIRPYLLVIILCWAGLRLGVRGTALLLLLIAGIAIGYTATGHSGFPLGGQDSTHRLLMVQLFLGVCGCFALLLAASQVERTGAEEALRYNQALLQSVTEDTSDAFYVKDTQGRYLMANAAAARFVGKSSEEVVGKNDTALFKPDEARQMMESDRRVLASGIAQTQEEVLTTREGKVSTLLSTKGPVRDAQGQVVGVFGITRDITERKQSEEAFERTAREWQTTFDATNDAIWILDNHHRVLRSNRTAEGYFHRPCHEMLGQHCWAIVHGATEPHPNCPFIRARQSGQRETMDLQQGQRWFEIIVDPIRDAAGQYDGAVHIVCDISERKRAEKTLRDSEELYISLVENLPQNVFRKDRDGRFLFGNQRFCQSAGHSLRKLVGKTDADFFPPNITKAYRQDDLRVMESGQALEQIEEHLSGDGRKLFVQVVRTPLRDASGTVMGIQGIFWDITERKQAEALKETLLSLTSRLSVASTSADLARSVFAAADRLWKWDSGTLEVNSADGATTDAVMCIDVVEGERRVVPPTGTRSYLSPRLRWIMAHGGELLLRTKEQMKVSDSIAFGDTSRLSASLMCVPIRQRGKPVGVFSIQSYSQNAFTSADLQTLQGLADHCGGALERI